MTPYTPAGIPDELKALERWALSAPNMENFFGKPFSEKAPIIPVEGRDYALGVKPNDPNTWRSFAYVDGWQDHVGGYPGIMIAEPYIGIDFDLEKGSAEYRAWVETECLPRCPGYVERSPSGHGYRVIIKGTIPKSRRTKVLEVYNKDRFLRITGNVMPPATMPMEEQQWLDWIYPSGADAEDIEKQGVNAEFIDFDDAKAIYEHVLTTMPPNDRVVFEQADTGVIEGSDACFAVCVALAKVPEIEANTAYTILLALEGIQNYYQSRYNDKAGNELHRKFSNYWWPDAQQRAVKAITKEAQEAEDARLMAPKVELLLSTSLASKQAAVEAVKVDSEPKLVTKGSVPDFPRMPDTYLFTQLRQWLNTNIIGGMKEPWTELHICWLSQYFVSHFVTMSGKRVFASMLLSAISGSGKASLDDMLDHLMENAFRFAQNKNSIGEVGSDTGIRNVLSRGIMTLLSTEEAGAPLSAAADPEGTPNARAVLDALLTAANKNKILPKAISKENKNYNPEPIEGFNFAAHISTQPESIGKILTPHWIGKGGGMRYPLCILPEPRGMTAAYRKTTIPASVVAYAEAVADLAMPMMPRIDVETYKYGVEEEIGFRNRISQSCRDGYLLPGGKAYMQRLPELALRYAVVHHVSKYDSPSAMIGGDVLQEDDLAFGEMMVRYHTKCMLHEANSDFSTSQDPRDRREKIVLGLFQQFAAKIDRMKKAGDTSAVKLAPSTLAQNLKSLSNEKGRPKAGEVRVAVTKVEVLDALEHLEADGVVARVKSSWLLAEGWHQYGIAHGYLES